MPKFGVLNIEPAQQVIREVFLRRIVKAKGLSKTDSLLSGILMPTPSAVMRAIELLANGCEEESGIGELLAVDVGGATTDVYSVSEGAPARANTVCKGLPEPYVKRTVEGDIGMRYSVRGILDAAGPAKLSRISGLPVPTVLELTQFLREHTDTLPDGDPKLEALDRALASCAIETAVIRHAGSIEEAYTLMGLTYVQTGKDLTPVTNLVVTGGSLIHTTQTSEIASYALYDPAQPMSLRPKEARVLVDRQYILSAMGLLAASHPTCALRIMKKGDQRWRSKIKKIPEGEFMKLRQEVLTQWPTGKGVDLEEAFAFHKSLLRKKSFLRSSLTPRSNTRPWSSPEPVFP